MSSEEKSLSDLLRDHINGKLDEKFDYSQRSNITADIKNFCEKYPNREFKEKPVRASHYKILNQCMKNKGQDPKNLGRERKKLKFNKGLASRITPKGVDPSSQAGKTGAEKSGEAKLQKRKIKKLVYDKDGKPIGEAEVEVFTSEDGTRVYHDWEHFDEEGVSASINAFYIMIRVAYPELESLTPEEKKSLGKMWLPAFKRYLSENWAYVGVPFLATMGLMLPKIATARREHKKGEPEKKKDDEKASQEEAERHDEKKICQWCRKDFVTWQDLKTHKRTCRKKPKGVK